MADEIQPMRLSLAAKKMNLATGTIVECLLAKGFKVEKDPNAKLSPEQLQVLASEFGKPEFYKSEIKIAEPIAPVVVATKTGDDDLPLYFRSNKPEDTPQKQEVVDVVPEPLPELPKADILPGFKVLGKIDLKTGKPILPPQKEEPKKEEPPVVEVAPPVVKETPPPVVEVAPQVIEIVKPVVVETPVVEVAPPVVEVAPPVEKTPEPVAELPVEKPVVVVQEVVKVAPAPPVEEVAKPKEKPVVAEKPAEIVPEAPDEAQVIEGKGDKLKGLTVLGKIELPVERKSGNNRNGNNSADAKKKRKRITTVEQDKKAGNNNKPATTNTTPGGTTATPAANTAGGQRPAAGGNTGGGNNANRRGGDKKGGNRRDQPDVTEVRDNLRNTMASMGASKKQNFGADRRRERRQDRAKRREEAEMQQIEDDKVLKVTEFIAASDLASLMDVSVAEVISTCMSMGMFVSINQRLDAEAITIIADEFGYDVQFVSAEEETEAALLEEADAEEDLLPRAPIVTIMGHVDHGKTSLLDYIRKSKVAAGEAGGITQHIGAYSVTTKNKRPITFLDTPGHEAFTAMRARGAKVTDVAIIVIAADDSVMPQTREAINHAQNANVPMVFAMTKIDKPGANPEKVREELAQMNILVEGWGGKFQEQEVSSKSGLGIPELLEKVLLEAEFLDLKANPNKRATGTVIEASLDKGRGYVATVLVETGTLAVGDVMLAGQFMGKVKAMFDDDGKKVKKAGPAQPVQILGLSGAPTAGDKLNVTEDERSAREIANKREQINREQSLRTRKHITLEEIGRRKAIGNFKELNIIVKGDVDGSVEALSDSLLKLSSPEVEVRIIHKGVGQVTESDILLASAADAIVVAFQVRPSANARKIADQEQIEVRTYSIIYQAIDDIKQAMEGMLEPVFKEVVTSNIEIREVFKITKIGTVAGCYVLEGTAKRNNKIRVIRDFIVIHEGDIQALKRFKDDVAEVKFGYECGLSIKGFNDLEVGDVIECFEMQEVKRKLT